MSFTVYPAVDISEGRCVRLLQGRFGTETVYSDDPVDVALGLARAGARWLHIVDLDGAMTGIPENRDLVLEVVRKSSCPVQAGGGVRSADDVMDLLAAGANRVVLGTIALEDPDEMRRACDRFGERIVVSLDARSEGGSSAELTSRGWTIGTGLGVLDAVKRFEGAGVSGFVYTDVGRDGTMAGPNLDGILRVAEATSLPVVASGGIGTLEELRTVARLHRLGIAGAIVGRAIYEDKFSVGEAIRAADQAAAEPDDAIFPPLEE
ncbi:MAG: 1-(5-phosphoribosyl)-5-[(5-phosphoribosylamino)methylideneamino]imidazole-4-carboxamide isomerase [Actinomycetota bacterium]